MVLDRIRFRCTERGGLLEVTALRILSDGDSLNLFATRMTTSEFASLLDKDGQPATTYLLITGKQKWSETILHDTRMVKNSSFYNWQSGGAKDESC